MQNPIDRTRVTAGGATLTLDTHAEASYRLARLAGLIPGCGFHRYVLVAQPRAGLPAMPRGFTVTPLTDDELAGTPLDTPAEAVRHRRAMGATCLAARDAHGTITGFLWLTDRPFREDEIDLWYEPGAHAAWDMGLYVRPAFRLGRSYAALWAGAAHWLAARGLDWSLCRITDYNAAAQAAPARRGGRKVGTVWALTVGRWQLTASTLSPNWRWHRVGGDAAPRLALGAVVPAA